MAPILALTKGRVLILWICSESKSLEQTLAFNSLSNEAGFFERMWTSPQVPLSAGGSIEVP